MGNMINAMRAFGAYVAIAGALLLAALGGGYAAGIGDAPPAMAEAIATGIRQPLAPSVHAATLPPAFSAALVPARADSKARQIERMTASADPHDAFRAFQIAVECKQTREAQRRGEAGAASALDESCGDITPLQLRGMGSNLERAVHGKVQGAIQALLVYGPLDGDDSALETRPSDPLVVEWKHKVQDLFAESARQGDLDSMATLSQAYQMGFFDQKDAQLALAYEVARYDLLIKRTDPRHVSWIKNGQRLGDLTAQMTPDQISAATALGKKLVAECCQL